MRHPAWPVHRRIARVLVGAVLVVLSALLLTPDSASAHVRSTTGYSRITEQDGSVVHRLELEYELLAATLGLGQDALDAEGDDARDAALGAAEQEIASYLESTVRVDVDAVRCPATLEETGVGRRDGVPYAVLTTSYDCPGGSSGSYVITYGVFSEPGAVVDEHTNLVHYSLADSSGQYVFDSSHQELAVGEVGLASSSARFVMLGVEHIATGADHVLFVVALLLGAAGLRSVLKLAASFTAAHSVTLALAALGWVEVPADLVEPLIALSIAYLAAENLLGGEQRHRVAVTFGFGLVHGLGFAGALTFDTDVTWQLLVSLVTFNIGIEAGQALIILALFPLLLLVRRRFAWSRAAHALATVAIAATGGAWFVTRLLA